MKKKTKGFTLVELLVVIAILAILATVSVVGYLAFTSKAKQSADEAAVTQMNTVLAGEGVTNKPADVEEAKDMLEAAGFNVEDYTPLYSNYIFYYDSSENMVLIYDQEKQKVTYPEQLADLYSNYTNGNMPGFWYLLNDSSYLFVSIDSKSSAANDTDKLTESINSLQANEVLKLDRNVTFTNLQTMYNEKMQMVPLFTKNSQDQINIDLGGNTLEIRVALNIGGTYSKTGFFATSSETFINNVTISNGKIVSSTPTGGFIVNESSSLTLNNIEYINTNDSDSKENNSVTVNDYGSLTINNSTITNEHGTTASVLLYGIASETNIFNSTLISNAYGLTSNASGGQSWNIRARVENSTIITNNGSALLFNVPGTYEFNNCTIDGNGLGAVIRGGNATFENCTIKEGGENDSLASDIFNDGSASWEFSNPVNQKGDSQFKDGWKDGDKVQLGTLIIGDWGNLSYAYDASCTLINTSVYMNDTWSSLPIVYLSQDEGYTATLNYDSNCKFYKGTTSYEASSAIIKNTQDTFGNLIVNLN